MFGGHWAVSSSRFGLFWAHPHHFPCQNRLPQAIWTCVLGLRWEFVVTFIFYAAEIHHDRSCSWVFRRLRSEMRAAVPFPPWSGWFPASPHSVCAEQLPLFQGCLWAANWIHNPNFWSFSHVPNFYCSIWSRPLSSFTAHLAVSAQYWCTSHLSALFIPTVFDCITLSVRLCFSVCWSRPHISAIDHLNLQFQSSDSLWSTPAFCCSLHGPLLKVSTLNDAWLRFQRFSSSAFMKFCSFPPKL